jgi:putative effector of murein hydrolase LrgA (UPF0299 family)
VYFSPRLAPLGASAGRAVRPIPDLARETDGLVANMPILFVPVGAGAIDYIEVLQQHWPAISIGVPAGTAVTIGATAWLSTTRRQSPGAS